MIDNISRYVYEVYRLKSVSLAANKLFLSQPALSAAIKKAETELGAPIFNRKTLPFSLTAEGKIYIEAIEKMLQIEAQAKDHIQDLREMNSGTLKIATSTRLSYYVVPRILEVFHKKYPQIDINIIISDTDKLYDLLEKETADLIFIPADTTPDYFTAVTLFEETFVVAVSKNYPGSEQLAKYAVTQTEIIKGTYPAEKAITDMSLFHGMEFIYSLPNTNIHKKRKLLFGNPDITPYITSSADRQQLNYNLMQVGFGAFLTTDANIATMPPSDDCMFFVLNAPAARRNFCIVHAQEETSHSFPIVKEFIETATELFKETALQTLSRL